jgi:CheY-like chemotaxis protein
MKKIIVVENDIDTLDLMNFVLEDSGFEVIRFNKTITPDEIKIHNPNLIILDHFLGDGFGGDLCLQIKNNPSTIHIPVILYSASPGLDKIAQKSKADAFIEKPFDIVDLENMVKKLAI